MHREDADTPLLQSADGGAGSASADRPRAGREEAQHPAQAHKVGDVIITSSYSLRKFFKGLSHEMDLAFDDMYWLVLGLNRGRGPFFYYLGAPMIYIAKVYFWRLMRVYIGLIM